MFYILWYYLFGFDIPQYSKATMTTTVVGYAVEPFVPSVIALVKGFRDGRRLWHDEHAPHEQMVTIVHELFVNLDELIISLSCFVVPVSFC